MKDAIKYILVIGVLTIAFFSCEKEEIKRYDPERAAIEFNGKEYAYSFKKTGKRVDTVAIPFNIVGYPTEQVRHAKFVVVADSTTATPNAYEIGSAIVEPGAYQGVLKVKVMRSDEEFQDMIVYLRIAENDDFRPGVSDAMDYKLVITNKLVRPNGWTLNGWKEQYFLGNYSTAYYEFIIQATGETEFPYPDPIPGYNNDQVWSSSEKNAFLDKLKFELKKRNQREGSPLLHDDGPVKGKEVIVGKYYNI